MSNDLFIICIINMILDFFKSLKHVEPKENKNTSESVIVSKDVVLREKEIKDKYIILKNNNNLLTEQDKIIYKYDCIVYGNDVADKKLSENKYDTMTFEQYCESINYNLNTHKYYNE